MVGGGVGGGFAIQGELNFVGKKIGPRRFSGAARKLQPLKKL